MNSAREAYERAADALLRESGCTVRRFRSNSTGTAYINADDWGIEVPEPRGPVSFATFAHEVGHQMLHRYGSRPRWLEEVEAWQYALGQFSRFGLPGEDRARADAAKCLAYAAAKAIRRRSSPATAKAIIDRYPDWVWGHDSNTCMVLVDVTERAVC